MMSVLWRSRWESSRAMGRQEARRAGRLDSLYEQPSRWRGGSRILLRLCEVSIPTLGFVQKGFKAVQHVGTGGVAAAQGELYANRFVGRQCHHNAPGRLAEIGF